MSQAILAAAHTLPQSQVCHRGRCWCCINPSSVYYTKKVSKLMTTYPWWQTPSGNRAGEFLCSWSGGPEAGCRTDYAGVAQDVIVKSDRDGDHDDTVTFFSSNDCNDTNVINTSQVGCITVMEKSLSTTMQPIVGTNYPRQPRLEFWLMNGTRIFMSWKIIWWRSQTLPLGKPMMMNFRPVYLWMNDRSRASARQQHYVLWLWLMQELKASRNLVVLQ